MNKNSCLQVFQINFMERLMKLTFDFQKRNNSVYLYSRISYMYVVFMKVAGWIIMCLLLFYDILNVVVGLSL